MRQTATTVVALLLLHSVAASAQEARSPVEFGAGYGGFLVNNQGGDYTVGPTRPAFHVQLTLPFTPRFSFEALTTISSRTRPGALHVTDGLYVLQMKQRILSVPGERFHAFLTYGAAGYYAHLHQSTVTINQPNGTTTTINDYSYSHADPPFVAVIGGGFQRQIGSRAAFRADAQVATLLWAPFGVRLSTGISISLGELDDSTTRLVPGSRTARE